MYIVKAGYELCSYTGDLENNVSTDGQIAINRQIDVREVEGKCSYDGMRSVGDHEPSPRVCRSIYSHPRERRCGSRDVILNNPYALFSGTDIVFFENRTFRRIWTIHKFWTNILGGGRSTVRPGTKG